MENIEVVDVEIKPEVREALKEGELTVQYYAGYAITTPDGYRASAEDLKRVKGKIAELTEVRQTLTKPLDESKKRIMDLFRKPIDALTMVEGAIKRAIIAFDQAEEERRRKEEAKLQAEARERELKEKEKIEKQAAKLEAKGDADGAEMMRAKKEEVYVPQPIVESRVEKVAGVHKLTTWHARIISEQAVPREFCIPDVKKLEALAKATKGTMKIAGVEFFAEQTISSRKA